MHYGYVIAALWLAWIAYWFAASVGTKAIAREESWQSRLGYSAPLWLTAFLLLNTNLTGPLNARFLPDETAISLLGVVLTAAGLAFAVWARLLLGGNWSAQVTVKADHELIRTGPYAIVRHPIYTGLALALLGTAFVIGEWRAFLAFLIATASFWYKLGIEERVMAETFGEAYEQYRRSVKALIPFVL